MKLPVFSVYDSKASCFGLPHVMQNAEVAIREFANAANSPESWVFRNPEDFSLIEVGTFDESTGVIDPCDHVNHGMARSFKRGE